MRLCIHAGVDLRPRTWRSFVYLNKRERSSNYGVPESGFSPFTSFRGCGRHRD